MSRAKKYVKNFWKIIQKPEMLVLPGQLAFFFILSIVPILTIITYLTSTFNIPTDTIFEFFKSIFGNDISTLLLPHTTNTLSVGFFVTIIIAFFFASNGASSIIITSNTIYGIKDKGFIHRRIKAIIMTFFLIALFSFILIVPIFGDKIVEFISFLNIDEGITHTLSTIIKVLNGPLSLLIIFIIIKLLYVMAPDLKLASSRTTYGALFTSIGWLIATGIYSFYINNIAHYSKYYGSFTNIIILMLWTYLLAYIFTIGMAINYKKDEKNLENTRTINITSNIK